MRESNTSMAGIGRPELGEQETNEGARLPVRFRLQVTQEGSVRQECSGLAPMYPAFGWSIVTPGHHGCKRAFDLIIGQASSGGYWGHQFSIAPGRPLLHRFLSLSQTSVGNGSQPCMITPPLSRPFLLFDRAAGFLPPRPPKMPRPARAETVKADPFQGHPKGSALTASSTTATLAISGPPHVDMGSDTFLISKLRP
jgi:hypothetical protein